MATKYKARDLGPLPVDLVNIALGTKLEPGRARLSKSAHQHIAEAHPDDYAACFAALPAAIARPTFIGQAPGHTHNFEMVHHVRRSDDNAVLVAVGLVPDKDGTYRVRSCYLISAGTVEARRRKGRLKPTQLP